MTGNGKNKTASTEAILFYELRFELRHFKLVATHCLAALVVLSACQRLAGVTQNTCVNTVIDTFESIAGNNDLRQLIILHLHAHQCTAVIQAVEFITKI